MPTITRREPLITTASITAAVTAVIGLLVSFGVPLTGDQQTAILGVVAVLAPLAVALVARHKVSPVDVQGRHEADTSAEAQQ